MGNTPKPACAADPLLERLRRVRENEPLCRLVERDRPEVHTDLVDEVDRAALGLPDLHVWCPDPRRFSFYALYRGSGRVFAFAAGMLAVSLRLPEDRVSEALADGGQMWPAAGPEWVNFRVFDGPANVTIMRERLRRWCAAAHAASG